MTNFAEKKSMSRLFSIAFWMFAGLLSGACNSGNPTATEVKAGDAVGDSSHRELPIRHRKELADAVQQQSRLYTTACHVRKIVLYSDDTRMGGKLLDIPLPGTRKVAIPIDVTLKAYVDFADFSEQNVTVADSICIITLPDPKVVVTASRVDHRQTRQYISMTRSKFSEEEISRLTAQGEDSIVDHIGNYGIIAQSREDCARVLVPMIQRMGFEARNIIVRYRKEYSEDEIRKMTRFRDMP